MGCIICVNLQDKAQEGHLGHCPPSSLSDSPPLPPYWFSTASGTNDHALSGFKQHKLVLLQLQRSNVWSGSYWTKIKVSDCWGPSLGLRGRSISGVSQMLKASYIPWFMASASIFKGNHPNLSPIILSPLTLTLPPSYKDPYNYVGPTS